MSEEYLRSCSECGQAMGQSCHCQCERRLAETERHLQRCVEVHSQRERDWRHEDRERICELEKKLSESEAAGAVLKAWMKRADHIPPCDGPIGDCDCGKKELLSSPSGSEFLEAIRACIEALNEVDSDDDRNKGVLRMSTVKYCREALEKARRVLG